MIVAGLRAQSAPQIKQATMEFAVWAFQQAKDNQMKVMAPLAFRGMMRMLEKMPPNEGRGSEQLRGFLYEAAGLLAEVCVACVPCTQRLSGLQQARNNVC